MKMKLFTYLSNGTLILGTAIGLYVLVQSYILKNQLPAGACPITNNRPFLYAAIILCLISFVLSFVEPKKRQKPESE